VAAIENHDRARLRAFESRGEFGWFDQVQWQFLYNQPDSLVNQVYGD